MLRASVLIAGLLLGCGFLGCAPPAAINAPKPTPAEMADALATSLPVFGAVSEVASCEITPAISARLVIVHVAVDWLPSGSPIALDAETPVLVQRSRLPDLSGARAVGAKLNSATLAGDARLDIDCGGSSPEGMLLATSVVPQDALLAPVPDGFDSEEALTSFVQERWEAYGAPFGDATFVQLLIDDDPERN